MLQDIFAIFHDHVPGSMEVQLNGILIDRIIFYFFKWQSIYIIHIYFQWSDQYPFISKETFPILKRQKTLVNEFRSQNIDEAINEIIDTPKNDNNSLAFFSHTFFLRIFLATHCCNIISTFVFPPISYYHQLFLFWLFFYVRRDFSSLHPFLVG